MICHNVRVKKIHHYGQTNKKLPSKRNTFAEKKNCMQRKNNSSVCTIRKLRSQSTCSAAVSRFRSYGQVLWLLFLLRLRKDAFRFVHTFTFFNYDRSKSFFQLRRRRRMRKLFWPTFDKQIFVLLLFANFNVRRSWLFFSYLKIKQ